MKIILTGASGTGKTSILEQFNDYDHICEVARTLHKIKGIELNEAGNVETQKLIWAAYKEKLDQSRDASYISDRGLIDVLSYTEANLMRMDKTDPEYKEMDELYRNQINEMIDFALKQKDIVYVYLPIEFPMEDDGVRSKNEEYRIQTDKIMKNWMMELKEMGINYLTVHGSVDERVQQIRDYINDLKYFIE